MSAPRDFNFDRVEKFIVAVAVVCAVTLTVAFVRQSHQRAMHATAMACAQDSAWRDGQWVRGCR